MNHIDQIWPGLLRQALDNPQVDGTQGKLDGEIVGAHVVLDGAAEQFCLNPRRKLSPIYASAELLWYLSGTFDGTMIKAYAPQYEKFLDPIGWAQGAYGGRLAHGLEETTDGCSDEHLLEEAIKLLLEKPYTKKCVVSLWHPVDILRTGYNEDYALNKDVPCTISWQFIRRGEFLHMICNMRSNDLWLGFLYDCYVNTVIQRYVASMIGCIAGEYHHIAGSLHLYERNKKAAEEVGVHRSPLCYPSAHECGWSDRDLQLTLTTEAQIRTQGAVMWNELAYPTPLHDALACCIQQFVTNDVQVRSPVLRQALRNFR